MQAKKLKESLAAQKNKGMRTKKYIKKIMSTGIVFLFVLAGSSFSHAEDYAVINQNQSLDSGFLGDSTDQTKGETLLDYSISDTRYDELPAADGNTISEERLADSVIDYDELGTFVNNYNASVLSTRTTLANSEQSLRDLLSELFEEYDTITDRMDDLETDMPEEAAEYGLLQSYKTAYNKAIEGYKDSIDALSERSSVSTLKDIERNQTKAAQSLYIAYQIDILTEDAANKSLELYEAQYANILSSLNIGLATQNDLLRVQTARNEAQASLDSARNNKQDDYADLLKVLGVDASKGYTIGTSPEPDTSFINTIDEDSDREQYINNNPEVKSIRHADAGGGTLEQNIKAGNLEYAMSDASISYDTLLQNLKTASESFYNASLSWQNTLTEWNLNQQKESLGMLSSSEYIDAQLSYLEGLETYQSSKLSLLTAINNYSWGIKGYAS